MNGKEKYDLSDYIKNAQKKIKDFVLEKNQLNISLKNFILNLQNIDSEIYNLIFNARVFYYEKRYNYNNKLEKLKSQKIEYERSWNNLTKKISTLQRPIINSNTLVSVDYTKRSIEEIEHKINILKKTLDEQILEINEENELIEKLRILESNKQIKITSLDDIQQKQTTKLQSSDYYITQQKIRIYEKNLKEIHENLNILSKKRLITHKKVLDLYKKAREFENIKEKIIKELIENKTTAEDFLVLFSKLMNQNKKMFLNKLSNSEKNKLLLRKIEPHHIKAIVKKKKKIKRLEKEKLAIALDKKKTGKKLDFYELQLILKHSKNKRMDN